MQAEPKTPEKIPRFNLETQWSYQHVFLVPSKVFLLLGGVVAVIISLHSLQNGFHLLGLAFPFLITHLGLPSEEFLIGFAIATTQTIPQGSELPVVVVEVEVMHGMTSGSVHNRAVGDILAIMNEDSPEVDEGKEEDIGHFLQGEEEGEHMVWHTLGPAVQGVESVGGVRARHDPFVMRLVEGFVDARVVKATVDPVDEEIGEEDEEGELQDAVIREGLLGNGVIELGVAPDFQNKERRSQQGHWGHGAHGLLHFHGDLVSQELGVVVGGFVPDEDIRERRNHEVDQESKDPGLVLMKNHNRWCQGGRRIPSDQEEAGELAVDVISRPRTEIGIFGGFEMNQLGGWLVDKRFSCPEQG